MTTSQEKWPAIFKVTKITDSIVGFELILYFITAITNGEQLNEIKNKIKILAEFEIDSDKYVATTILNHEQVNRLFLHYQPLAKQWRGKWYSLANAIVDGCQEAQH